MKKCLLAGAALVTLTGTAHAQSSVTLYGLIDAGLTYTNSQISGTGSGGHSNWQMTSGSVQYSRWGLRGAEDLGGGLKAIFTLESGFNVNNGQLSSNNRLFNRQAFVGLTSREYGTLTLGRQTDDMVDFVAPLSLTGTEFGGVHFTHPFDVDNQTLTIRSRSTTRSSMRVRNITDSRSARCMVFRIWPEALQTIVPGVWACHTFGGR